MPIYQSNHILFVESAIILWLNNIFGIVSLIICQPGEKITIYNTAPEGSSASRLGFMNCLSACECQTQFHLYCHVLRTCMPTCIVCGHHLLALNSSEIRINFAEFLASCFPTNAKMGQHVLHALRQHSNFIFQVSDTY